MDSSINNQHILLFTTSAPNYKRLQHPRPSQRTVAVAVAVALDMSKVKTYTNKHYKHHHQVYN